MTADKFVKKWLLVLPLLYITSIALAGYYGGTLPNHGHTAAAGDGGPLANPVFTGTATINNLTSTVAVIQNLTVTGTATLTNTSINTLTVTSGLIVSTMPVSISTLTVTSSMTVLGNGTFHKRVSPVSVDLLYDGNEVTSDVHQILNNNNQSFGTQGSYTGWRDTNNLSQNTGWSVGNLDDDFLINYVSSSPFPTHQGANSTTTIGIARGRTSKELWLKGDVTGATVLAGYIGELVSSTTVAPIAVAATGTVGVLGSIILSTGSWNMHATAIFNRNGASFSSTDLEIFISSSPGTQTSGILNGKNYVFDVADAPLTFTSHSINITSWKVNNTETKTYYIKSLVGAFTVAVPTAYFYFEAIRIPG